MNRQQLHAALSSATTTTFEELGLLLSSSMLDVGQRAVPLAGGVRLDFAGPCAGAVVVRVTEDVLAAAAANMLAADEAPAEPLQRDALGELANVLCGTLLPTLAGRRAMFRLQPPRWMGAEALEDAARREGGAAALGAPVAATRLGVESGRVEVALYLPEARIEDARSRR
jgi:hypothetical protein